MAIIASVSNKAEVQAMGTAKSANVNLSGALMEMLATVYVHILLAAIREAIQNACDASNRAGMTFEEGVQVHLPTESNPVFTVIDSGSGMSAEFMESTYLSFGSSTKAGDNGSAGGLGVGRWAAYGYIRECYIVTCHESDMIERTYFQFQGEESMPKVQLASEVPGTKTGTRVFFPVKAEDLPETLRIVAWLKEVMQLTMGDSFSVFDGVLPEVLPKHSGMVVDLGDVDPTLVGVKVYPMQGSALQYAPGSRQDGSLVVLTNKEAGVGGLPFHVRARDTESVFSRGMVVEVPMRFQLPFMPSREELKYTSDVYTLLAKIDDAARTMFIRELTTMYRSKSLTELAKISNFLGGPSQSWHYFSALNGSRTSPRGVADALTALFGGSWRGKAHLAIPPSCRGSGCSIRFADLGRGTSTLSQVYADSMRLAISMGATKGLLAIDFPVNKPLTIVQDDLASTGMTRLRTYLKGRGRDCKDQYLYVGDGGVAGSAAKLIAELNDAFGGALPVMRTSGFPAPAKVIVGSSVKRASAAISMTYYDTVAGRQDQDVMTLTSPLAAGESLRVWIHKTGGQIAGIHPAVQLQDMLNGELAAVLKRLGVKRLYFFNNKNVKFLEESTVAAEESGAGDVVEDADAAALEEESGWSADEYGALKSWVSLEDAVARFLAEDEQIKGLLAGKVFHTVQGRNEILPFITRLAYKPRMELIGSKFDKMISEKIDLMTGVINMPNTDVDLYRLCRGLATFGGSMAVGEDETAERLKMIEDLKSPVVLGNLNYNDFAIKLFTAFPLVNLGIIGARSKVSEAEFDAFCVALSKLYP